MDGEEIAGWGEGATLFVYDYMYSRRGELGEVNYGVYLLSDQ